MTPTKPTLIDRTWIVGTSDACAIRVDDPWASAAHCRIDRVENDGGYLVTDLGTTNGTWIQSILGDRRQVRRMEFILPGETLIVGRSHLLWGSGSTFIFERALPQPEDERSPARPGSNLVENLPHDPLCEGGRCGCGKRVFPDD